MSRRRDVVVTLVCVAAVIGVEAALIASGHLLAGAIADGVLVLLLAQGLTGRRAGPADDWRAKSAIRGLALVPLIRVVALGLPLRDGSDAVGLLVVAILIGSAAWGLAPTVDLGRRALFTLRPTPFGLGVALAGLLLGLVAYLLGAPALWPAGAGPGRAVVALAAAVCAAGVEEIVFRGVVQMTLARILGEGAVLAAGALFAATYLGEHSAAVVLVFALAGLTFGHAVARTASLTAAVCGHALLVIGAGALWPALLGRSHGGPVSPPGAIAGLGVAVVLMAAFVIRGARAARPADEDEDEDERPVDVDPERPLLEAIEGLDPAARALLDLWLAHGLDDDRIAALTRIDRRRVADRQQLVVAEIAERLGLPRADVRDALERLFSRRRALRGQPADGPSAPAGAGAPPQAPRR